jgi:hypothetical protein
MWNTRKLSKRLSYPLYKESWNNKFISFNVEDTCGSHQLFAITQTISYFEKK